MILSLIHQTPAMQLRDQTPARRSPSMQPEDEQQQQEKAEALFCRACLTAITHRSAAIEFEGRHEHLEVNPAGVIYHIGCFGEARCRIEGEATAEWSWFQSYAWQVALCPGCGVHLGWYFSSPARASFYGLILARLQEAPPLHH